MTAPVLAQKKFWIVKPKAAINQIKNPAFASPDFEEDWAASGAGVTIAESGDYQRRGAYSMKVNTATGVASGAYHGGLTVTDGDDYTFSCDVKGVAGQAMRIYIANVSGTAKATTTFTATGYWQRVEVTHTAAENASTYRVYVIRDAVASTEPFYVDGAQFEQASKASTFFDGYSPGCRWTGTIRNSPSARSVKTGLGGELVDLSTYCEIVSVSGLGHGDWNQILTKMTSGGDMYQTHTRKSRNFSIVVDFIGDTLGAIEANRKAVIDMLRPDLLSNMSVPEQFGINWGADYRGHEQRIIRYQGFAANGDEATQPIDIVCVPLSASMVDTPDLPNHQRAVLNFVIPSGLLQGAYNEGKALDLYANFPAEFIVKRDPDGNWCKWTGSAYASLITGLNSYVFCMAEGPDGKIYVGGNFTDAGGVAGADYLARWNPATEKWEAVVSAISSSVNAMAFDANGDLYVGGFFTDLGSAAGDYIVKITDINGTPTVNALGTGTNSYIRAIAIAPNGDVYVGGNFTLAGGVANTAKIAKWNGTAWSALSTGLNNNVQTLAIAPNGDLYIGGAFTNAAYPYLCKWNGTAFSPVGTNTDIGAAVWSLAFGATGYLYVGGYFTNAGGNANADYIARWNGSSWSALGTGANANVYGITVNNGKVYIGGDFTSIGGLTLADRAAVWSNGSWQPLDINLPGTSSVNAFLPASDGSLYIGGGFSTAGETPDENAETGVVALNLNVASASANTYPFIAVNGPGTLKSITNYSTGKTIAFNGLTLQTGEWIGLNFDPLNLKFRGGWAGRGNLMRYVIAGSDYGDFYLTPGANNISVFMTDTTTASGAWIQWTPLFWGLDGALL
jgi:hypothetical protein